MKENFGKEISMDKEVKLLANGFEWYFKEEFYELLADLDDSYKFIKAGVDINPTTKKVEMILAKFVQKGYRDPSKTRGCRLRTGRPEGGR